MRRHTSTILVILAGAAAGLALGVVADRALGATVGPVLQAPPRRPLPPGGSVPGPDASIPCRLLFDSGDRDPADPCRPSFEAWACLDGSFVAIQRETVDEFDACSAAAIFLPPDHPEIPEPPTGVEFEAGRGE